MKRIEGRARTVRELLDAAKYTIDFYQREYAWPNEVAPEFREEGHPNEVAPIRMKSHPNSAKRVINLSHLHNAKWVRRRPL